MTYVGRTDDLRYAADLREIDGGWVFAVRVWKEIGGASPGTPLAPEKYAPTREVALALAQEMADAHRLEVAEGRALAGETVELR